MDYRGILLISGVLALLALVSFGMEFFRRRLGGIDVATLSSCRSRINSWWLLFGSLICALLLGTATTVLYFGVVSFWALREYVTITPTRLADHKMLVGVFFVLTPLQFVLVGVDPVWFSGIFRYEPYFFYSAMIPSLAFLILPACVALSDDTKYFLERVAKLQVGLLICVYSLSFVPALLTMYLPVSEVSIDSSTDVSEIYAANLENNMIMPLGSSVSGMSSEILSEQNVSGSADSGINGDSSFGKSLPSTSVRERNPLNLTLLFVFVLLTQVSDIAQFSWSLAFPKHKIAPKVNSNRSYEGFFLGVLTTTLVAIALWKFTPFDCWEKAAIAGIVISVMGFAGNITMSAIKREQGIGDYETLIADHNGVLDRIDSLCFAAPVFFHYVRVFC